jgi:competence protein ComEC
MGTAGLALGFALAGLALDHALRDRLDPALDGMRVEFVGVIEDLARHESRRLVVTVRIEAPAGLPARARIAWYEPTATPRPGERWRFRAKLQRPRGVVNSGSASREGWLLRQRVGATGYASGPVGAEHLAGNADWLLDLRGRSAARIDAAVDDPRAAAVLTAIALGFRGGLDAKTREALVATGTGHLLAISGLHVGLAAAAGNRQPDRSDSVIAGTPLCAARSPCQRARLRCGSMSSTATRCPADKDAARLAASVVLPAPPFCWATVITTAMQNRSACSPRS